MWQLYGFCEVNLSYKTSEIIATAHLQPALIKDSTYEMAAKQSTNSGESLEEDIKSFSTLIPRTQPRQYKLKFNKTPVGRGGKLEKCFLDQGGKASSISVTDTEKVIMMVGATGAGKSTLINGFANYIFGIQWEDDFRIRVIDDSEHNQSESQTKKITAYTFPKREGMKIDYRLTIIDTPGFGDTGGIQRDKEITEVIKSFFLTGGFEGIDQLHGVLFDTPASQPRLTPTQSYIFEAILGIFGKDIEGNIFLMTTFADGQTPKVLGAVRKARVPFAKFFKFNNSALYVNKSATEIGDERGDTDDESEDSEDEREDFDKPSWKMGMKSFKRFYKTFDKVEAKSLILTREVVYEREHLQLVLQEMPKKIGQGLLKIDELQQEEKVVRSHESDISISKDYKYTVSVTKQRRIDLKNTGVFVTNCLICNITCHKECIFSNNTDKHKCSAMVRNSDIDKIHCGVCAKKCSWRSHVNNPYRLEEYQDEEERTSDELYKRYEQATSNKSRQEQAIGGLKKALKVLEDDVMKLIQEAKKHLERLHEIALRPINISEVDYIDLLIAKETQEAKPGFLERAKTLVAFRKQAELISTVSNVKLDDEVSVFEAMRGDVPTTAL